MVKDKQAAVSANSHRKQTTLSSFFGNNNIKKKHKSSKPNNYLNNNKDHSKNIHGENKSKKPISKAKVVSPTETAQDKKAYINNDLVDTDDEDEKVTKQSDDMKIDETPLVDSTKEINEDSDEEDDLDDDGEYINDNDDDDDDDELEVDAKEINESKENKQEAKKNSFVIEKKRKSDKGNDTKSNKKKKKQTLLETPKKTETKSEYEELVEKAKEKYKWDVTNRTSISKDSKIDMPYCAITAAFAKCESITSRLEIQEVIKDLIRCVLVLCESKGSGDDEKIKDDVSTLVYLCCNR